jgi:zinc and cadmium transporter
LIAAFVHVHPCLDCRATFWHGSQRVAGRFALRASPARIPMLISYAIGALLGAVFLEILPHALEQAASVHTLTAVILFGILSFFVLEKLVLWRHYHAEEFETHDHHADPDDQGRSGMMIMVARPSTTSWMAS